MATTHGPYYTNCARKRDTVYSLCVLVLGAAAIFGFVISTEQLYGAFFYSSNCFEDLDPGCISYNGQTYQYSRTPGVCYAMIVMAFGPLAVMIVTCCLFWFMKPPPNV